MSVNPDEICRQRIEWLGLALRVPDDWDIVEHGLNPMRGRLSFADRREQRFQLRWTRCKKPPAIPRMLDDYRDAQLEDDPEVPFEELSVDRRWRGLVRPRPAVDAGRMSRALWYDAKHKTLLEAIVTQPTAAQAGGKAAGLVDALLGSVRIKSPGESATRWSAFGVKLQTPEDFRATSVQVQAARVVFHFERLKEPGSTKFTGDTATLARLGMADGWFNGDLEKVLDPQKNHHAPTLGETILGPGLTGHAQATAFTAVGGEPGPRLKRFLGRLRTRRDLLWHCPATNNVMHIATHSFDRDAVDPLDFKLSPTLANSSRNAELDVK